MNISKGFHSHPRPTYLIKRALRKLKKKKVFMITFLMGERDLVIVHFLKRALLESFTFL